MRRNGVAAPGPPLRARPAPDQVVAEEIIVEAAALLRLVDERSGHAGMTPEAVACLAPVAISVEQMRLFLAGFVERRPGFVFAQPPVLDGESEHTAPPAADQAVALPRDRLAQADELGERGRNVQQGRHLVVAPRLQARVAADQEEGNPQGFAVEADLPRRDPVLAEIEAMVADDDEDRMLEP